MLKYNLGVFKTSGTHTTMLILMLSVFLNGGPRMSPRQGFCGLWQKYRNLLNLSFSAPVILCPFQHHIPNDSIWYFNKSTEKPSSPYQYIIHIFREHGSKTFIKFTLQPVFHRSYHNTLIDRCKSSALGRCW